MFDFKIADFELLDKLITKSKKNELYFDEIQVVEGWELYVRQKLDAHYKVCITGSNASLLSRELGTKLTGRHINKELFPFSYSEYLAFKSLDATEESLLQFMLDGGFPEYLKSGNGDILLSLFDDILYRDIAVRYGIRDVKSMKSLLLYIASNYGNLFSANKLTNFVDVKTAKTILEYLNYFEGSYLINTVPKFSWSIRTQIINPKKIYFIDTALSSAVSISNASNMGHLLENIIYWELRRHYTDIYYFNENNIECDFIVRERNAVANVIQVCYELTSNNENREISGVRDAMAYFKQEKGIIITMNQSDTIRVDEGIISVIPAYEFITKKSN